MTIGPGAKKCGDAVAETPRSVSLNVLPGTPSKRKVAKSSISKWRAGVLIGVYVLMFAHIVQWLIMGKTVAPVEPSESMYAIELGTINPGFVFFCVALLSTFIFGRFFCGWGCHIVALQDLCSHWMNKLGVRPKPLRSRLLVWAPFALALYMFVWPTFKAVALVPLEKAIAERVAIGPDGEKWQFPQWLVTLPRQPHPGYHTEFIVKDYWKTFPTDWYVIVPFLGVCGFAAVYFLGSKGFCTYGCPYGGFFAPMDKISIGRIVVDHDTCEQCGHCTAVCTSNVRVAQEVKDFGMVVDPGCMKCLDCVSVCPTGALSFSFARPAVFKKATSEEAKAGKVRRPDYDLPWWQDIVLLVLCVAFFIGFRGMFNKVPLLMGAGLGLAAGFIAWKLWTLITEPNVRLQSLQLKLKGRIKPVGVMLAVLGGAYLALGTWGIANQGLQTAANYYDVKVKTPFEQVFSAGYTPKPEDAANAKQVVKLLKMTGPFDDGGWGWRHTVEHNLRIAWNSAVAGDRDEAEKYLRRAIDLEAPSPLAPSRVFQLAQLLQLRGKSNAEVRAEVAKIANARPHLYPVRLALAEDLLGTGQRDQAVAVTREVLTPDKSLPDLTPPVLVQAGSILIRAGQTDEGIQKLEEAYSLAAEHEGRPDVAAMLQVAETMMQLQRLPRSTEIAEAVLSAKKKPAPMYQMQAVSLLLRAGQGEKALTYLPQIITHRKPRPDVMMLTNIGDLYIQAGKLPEAVDTLAQAVMEHPDSAITRATFARALAMTGKPDAALRELEAACRLDPSPEYLGAKAELLGSMGRQAEAQKAMEEAQAAARARGAR
jgi:polyferredoxin/tetratricopeptide (TPR) repeat protein